MKIAFKDWFCSLEPKINLFLHVSNDNQSLKTKTKLLNFWTKFGNSSHSVQLEKITNMQGHVSQWFSPLMNDLNNDGNSNRKNDVKRDVLKKHQNITLFT